MHETAADNETLLETLTFLNHLNDLPAPHQRGKMVYPLDEVLLLTRQLCT